MEVRKKQEEVWYYDVSISMFYRRNFVGGGGRGAGADFLTFYPFSFSFHFSASRAVIQDHSNNILPPVAWTQYSNVDYGWSAGRYLKEGKYRKKEESLIPSSTVSTRCSVY